ncbi:Homeobox-leucine zipper family protein [Rhynchospora pubera]|uniref:Homeobox-leucine zipper family protein n=1 Tax=Rhynchospora pubera TaxID=906938 RepID=A0AAV8CVV4_9POAL|nr:Homeobox-leucine zipper family protein [Rhynchospora pubera]
MMIGKEDLALSLSLSPTISTATNCRSHQFNLMPSFSSLDTRTTLPTSLRGIDMNQAPVTEREDSEEDMHAGVPSSPNSTNSSSSGKRNGRDQVTFEERMIERAGSRGMSDDEDGGDGSRKKLRLSKDQSAVLEESFKEHNTLNPKQKAALAQRLNLRPRQVEVWFQNRRARTKLKQTEVDCEFLKRCCENLTEENRRLQKELQELRALKLSPQFYMQMNPPTTLTMCPSCERVSSSSVGNSGSAGSSAATVVPPSMHQTYQHHRSIVPAPWAPIPLRPAFLDTPPQRS